MHSSHSSTSFASASSIMGNKQIKQHLETAQKTGVLKISLQRLQDFPPQLKQFPNVLKTIGMLQNGTTKTILRNPAVKDVFISDFSENRFVQLPPEIGRFTLVKHLNISGNRLTDLPDVLGELIKLEVFLAHNNFIVQVPRSLSNCKNLKTVNLSNNQIQEFPLMLCGLKHLDALDLSRNKIVSIPDGIEDLQVTELNVNQNQISSLSELVADCPKLKTLRIEENCLQVTCFTPKLLKNSKICNICIDGNLFQSKRFQELDGYDEYQDRYTAVKKKMF